MSKHKYRNFITYTAISDDDLIRRGDAIKALIQLLYEEPPYLNSEKKRKAFAEKVFDDIPAVEPKQGEWITDVYKLGKERHRCSECGKGSVEDSNYCPNCGCRMKGADNDSRRADKETE